MCQALCMALEGWSGGVAGSPGLQKPSDRGRVQKRQACPPTHLTLRYLPMQWAKKKKWKK